VIYLDNNATTEIDPRVIQTMMDCWQTGPMNPSSQHAFGRTARNLIDDAISAIGQWLHADVDSPGGDRLLLTSGGSEANNLALHGIGDPQGPLVVSAIEHPSVLAVASSLQAMGRELRVIPTLPTGQIDVDAALKIITTGPRPALVSVMAANNETGVIQPTDSIAEICRDHDLPLHIDATQVIGKLPFDFTQSAAAAVTFTAHKFHGPGGIGGLLLRSDVNLRPQMFGGEQQLGKRPGTEPVPLVVGMMKALEIAIAEMTTSTAQIRDLRDSLEAQIAQRISDVVFHGQSTARLPGTSCFSFPHVDRQAMLMALDLAGIACSSGSACASGSSRPSHVLEAMGLSNREIQSALRVGLSRFSTADEVDRSIDIICRQHQRLRALDSVEKSA